MLECADATKFLDRVIRDSRHDETINAVVLTHLRILASLFSILADFKENHAFDGIAHAIGAIMNTFEKIPSLTMVSDGRMKTKIMDARRLIADVMTVLKGSLESILAGNQNAFYHFVQEAYRAVSVIETTSLEFLIAIPLAGMMNQ